MASEEPSLKTVAGDGINKDILLTELKRLMEVQWIMIQDAVNEVYSQGQPCKESLEGTNQPVRLMTEAMRSVRLMTEATTPVQPFNVDNSEDSPQSPRGDIMGIVPAHLAPPLSPPDFASASSENSRNEEHTSRRSKKKAMMFASVSHVDAILGSMSILERFVSSRTYEMLSVFLIFMSAVFTGWQTNFTLEQGRDFASRGLGQEDALLPPGILIAEAVFCMLFWVDLTLRWMASGFFVFFQAEDDRTWNILDVIVVGLTMVDTCLEIAVASSSSKDSPLVSLSVLRIARLLRVVRVLRFIRVLQIFKELRVMVMATLGCFRSLLWVAVVLGGMLYMFAILFCGATSNYLQIAEQYEDPENEDLLVFFGTFGDGLLILFAIMSGGQEWHGVYHAVIRTGWVYGFLLVFYVVFANLAVLNIVTGIFVDSAMAYGSQDLEVALNEERQSKQARIESLRELFEDLTQGDADRMMTFAEFQKACTNPNVRAFFQMVKLDFNNARELFDLIDYDNSGKIDVGEFMEGCQSLIGGASAFDQKVMLLELRHLRELSLRTLDMVKTHV
mmetsp:Transcript_37506/g.67864  ORF Transcript_37506/g.67864 Transcript_37506/m.67864 type:complete len:560 (+) Transcript_37506:33-1712(+)